MLWLELGSIAVLVLLGYPLRCQIGRASAVGVGLMLSAGTLVRVSGGLTDMHIWFYANLALVALYQSWVPVLLAVAFVAVHHGSMSLAMPGMVYSTPSALEHPLPVALLHAVFLLAEAMFLAYGWKFTEDADRGRRAEQRRAEGQALGAGRGPGCARRGAGTCGRRGVRGARAARGAQRAPGASSPNSRTPAVAWTRTRAPRRR